MESEHEEKSLGEILASGTKEEDHDVEKDTQYHGL